MATYTGNSIVDYLKSVGQASDFSARAKLATTRGIQGYTGSADQNIQLLGMLRATTPQVQPAPVPQTPVTPALASYNPQLQIQGSKEPAPQAPQAAAPQAGPLTTQRTPDGRYIWIDSTTGQEKGIFNTKAEVLAARDKELGSQAPPAPPQAPPAAPLTPIGQGEFQKKPEETIDQYRERISKAFGEGRTAAPYNQFAGIGAPPATPIPPAEEAPPETDLTTIFSSVGLGEISTSMPIGDLLKAVTSAFGLSTQDGAKEVNKELTVLDDKFADEVASLNSNPWISEGLRSKQITQIQNKYETKKNALVERMRLYKDSTDSNLKMAGLVIDVYFKQKEIEKDTVLKKLEIASKQLESKAGLTTSQLQGAIDRVADDFRQDPVTKQYAQAGTGWSFLSGINTNTTNPADDIGAIYAFAKIMDPESVVREGEYATVQRYAQAWASTFAFKAERIFSNTKFLTADALKNMKAAAGAKFNSIELAHNSAKKTYEQRIEDLRAGKIAGGLPSYNFPSFKSSDASPGETIFSGSTKSGLKYKVIK